MGDGYITIDKEEALRLAEMLNKGGWEGTGNGYGAPDGRVEAEVLDHVLRLSFSPKKRAGHGETVFYDGRYSYRIIADPKPELIVLKMPHWDSRWPTVESETTIGIGHRTNKRANIRRRRRMISNRMKIRGVGCAWDDKGRLTLTFADGTALTVR